jgi:hypothetical protein
MFMGRTIDRFFPRTEDFVGDHGSIMATMAIPTTSPRPAHPGNKNLVVAVNLLRRPKGLFIN